MFKITGIIFLIFFSLTASAHWTGLKNIYSLKVQEGGIYVVLSGFTNDDAEIECSTGDGFFVPIATDELYESKVSFLLAAFMSNNKVNLSYNECYSTQYKLGSIKLK